MILCHGIFAWGEFWILAGCNLFDGKIICNLHAKWGELITKIPEDTMGSLLTHFVAKVVGRGTMPGTSRVAFNMIYAFSGKTALIPAKKTTQYICKDFLATEKSTTAAVAYESGPLPKPGGLRTFRRLKHMLICRAALAEFFWKQTALNRNATERETSRLAANRRKLLQRRVLQSPRAHARPNEPKRSPNLVKLVPWR